VKNVRIARIAIRLACDTFGRAPTSAIGVRLAKENGCQHAGHSKVEAMSTPRPGPLRQVRERELVAATRALFDERGMQDAPIEDIARTVGIARGLVYRHFSSKEELFVLTVTDYLSELEELLESATADEAEPTAQLERCTEAYAGFCQRYPAFLDSSLALMHRPARELREIVSESVWLRLGQGMATCLDQLGGVLRSGSDAGVFAVDDPDYMANVLWTQMLGVMHLARIRVGVRRLAPGVPALFEVEPDRIVRTCVASAMATVGARAG
jgi:AcrR family transcriptional regulator